MVCARKHRQGHGQTWPTNMCGGAVACFRILQGSSNLRLGAHSINKRIVTQRNTPIATIKRVSRRTTTTNVTRESIRRNHHTGTAWGEVFRLLAHWTVASRFWCAARACPAGFVRFLTFHWGFSCRAMVVCFIELRFAPDLVETDMEFVQGPDGAPIALNGGMLSL